MLWFRHGLRLHDNPALLSALGNMSGPFFPMFIFDGETAGISSELNRFNRSHRCLEINFNSSLMCNKTGTGTDASSLTSP